MHKKFVNGFGLSVGEYNEFIDAILSRAEARRSSYVCVANVHMFIEAYRDQSFRIITEQADIVTPDGLPLCWYLKLKHKTDQPRVAGMDLLPDLLRRMEKENIRAFFYGGTQEVIDATGVYLQSNYPLLPVAGLYSPPFRLLTEEEDEEIIKNINNANAQVVFVVLGCPRQEKWMAKMKGKINAVMIGIGGALPVMIGAQKRAPKWMQKTGLEWFFRLSQEPVRLFKRYAVTNTLFLYLASKDLILPKFSGKHIKLKA